MTALIVKDLVSLKKTLFLTIAISIAIAVYGIHENAIIMIPLLCTMIPLILTAIAFGYDTQSNFEQFAFSMPIKKSNYVISKLFFAFSFGLVGSLCLFFLLVVQNKMPIDTIFFVSLITWIFSILISSIQLPFMLKYGAEKGRLVMLITYFAVFALSTFLKENSSFLTKIMDLFSNNSVTMIFIGILLVELIIIAFTIHLSIAIMKKKEY